MSTRRNRRAWSVRGLAALLIGALTLASCGVATTPALKATGLPATSINVALQASACSASHCFAVGASTTPLPTTATAVRLTTNGALAPLATPTFTAGSFAAASCMTTVCYAAGTQDGHNVLWSFDPTTEQLSTVNQTAILLPGSSTGITALSCGPSNCGYIDATTSHVIRFVSYGANGHQVQNVPVVTDEHVDALGCATDLSCVVAVSGGASARVLRHSLITSGWTVEPTPANWSSVSAVSCVATCVYLATVAGKSTIAWSATKGWQTANVPFTANTLACLPGQRCVVVGRHTDGSGAAWWWHKGATRSVDLTYVPTALTSVGCGLTRCFAAGSTTAVELAP